MTGARLSFERRKRIRCAVATFLLLAQLLGQFRVVITKQALRDKLQ